MNKVSIAYSTKDRVLLSKQSIEPLRHRPFDLFWSDGSSTEAGEKLPFEYGIPPHDFISSNVRGGADPAILFNLTKLLNHQNRYEYIGLVENDVLLDPDWFEPTMQLFDRGKAEGLEVGAVSARAYEDRVLIQRDGYAVMHNLGAGQVILSRKAVELILQYARTGMSFENRRTFAQLTDADIGSYWAFRGYNGMLCWDWTWDKVLAQHGLASLALTPAKCTMIGQEPPLEQQGLKLVIDSVEARRNDKMFNLYADRTRQVREGTLLLPSTKEIQRDDGTWLYMPHQLANLGGRYMGKWRLKWAMGHGPFLWESAKSEQQINIDAERNVYQYANAWLSVSVSGPCALLVSGGDKGGAVNVGDHQSGFEVTLPLLAEGDGGQVLNIEVPGNICYREVRMSALSPGVRFYGLVTRERQPWHNGKFDYLVLPSP